MNVTEVPEQIVDPALLLILTSVITFGFTVMVIPLLTALEDVTQVSEDVSSHVTISPLLSVVVVNVLLFVPTFEPLIFHWKTGDPPPFVALALNVTEVPAQIVVAVAAIETDGVRMVETFIVIPGLVIEEGMAQVALLVNTQVTTSPLKSVDEVKVVLFVPTSIPFTFH